MQTVLSQPPVLEYDHNIMTTITLSRFIWSSLSSELNVLRKDFQDLRPDSPLVQFPSSRGGYSRILLLLCLGRSGAEVAEAFGTKPRTSSAALASNDAPSLMTQVFRFAQLR